MQKGGSPMVNGDNSHEDYQKLWYSTLPRHEYSNYHIFP